MLGGCLEPPGHKGRGPKATGFPSCPPMLKHDFMRIPLGSEELPRFFPQCPKATSRQAAHSPKQLPTGWLPASPKDRTPELVIFQVVVVCKHHAPQLAIFRFYEFDARAVSGICTAVVRPEDRAKTLRCAGFTPNST